MRGFLKARPAGSQFLLVISITLVSLFIIGQIGTFILAYLSGMSYAEVIDQSKWDYSQPSTIFVIRGLQIIQFIGFFLIPTFFAAWLFSIDTKKYLSLKKPSVPGYWIAGVGIMILAIPFSNWLGELNKSVSFPEDIETWMMQSEKQASLTVKAMLSRRTIPELLINLVLIAGLAAVGEELLFRGVIQRLLIRMFKSPWAGIIIAAALFSAIHMQFYGFFPRLLLGILLGAIYWFSGSLWVSILAHFVYDALLIIAAYYYPSLLNEDETIKMTNLAIAGTISFVLVVILLEWIRKQSGTRYSTVYEEEEKPEKNNPF